MGQQGSFGLALPWVVSQTILLPFVFDVVLTLVRRLGRGENVLKAHREHLYQRLMRAGLTHAEALRMAMLRVFLCAGVAVAFYLAKSVFYGWLGFAVAVAIMIQYWLAVRRIERRAGMAGEG
jgi:Fuc2NAc and GlcNAc transferase